MLLRHAALELSDGRVRPARLLARASPKQDVQRSHHYCQREHGRHADLQAALEGDGVTRHLLGDCDRLEGRVGDLLTFLGDARFFVQLIKCALAAQLRPHARQQLGRLPRAREHIVGAEIEPAAAFARAAVGKQDHANSRRGCGALYIAQHLAAVQVCHIGVE